jgi:2-hydroxyacyl-CoA lyase 1
MGKGVVSDEDSHCVSPARSLALKDADVVLLLGARLNWILHYGGRFTKQCRIIHVDIEPTELGNNVTPAVAINADVG